MDKCREEFDEWYENHGKAKPFTTVCIKDKMFESWQASRESMKAIKLPKRYVPIGAYKPDYDVGFDDSIDMCKDAITSAGYKVEE